MGHSRAQPWATARTAAKQTKAFILQPTPNSFFNNTTVLRLRSPDRFSLVVVCLLRLLCGLPHCTLSFNLILFLYCLSDFRILWFTLNIMKLFITFKSLSCIPQETLNLTNFLYLSKRKEKCIFNVCVQGELLAFE